MSEYQCTIVPLLQNRILDFAKSYFQNGETKNEKLGHWNSGHWNLRIPMFTGKTTYSHGI